ncbi:YbaB/EbfC family nucleoid-associated protein [Pelagibacteraceae bacterium]|jgi:DNA-binding YbaB/EbfC family protein|nr:YbaB/EbfC family nucleoid-associated protein [Pelagibacteraceae bacterium]MDC0384980.1 YbaB/EbfC family nucleoid-associated protein [bacterium]MDC0425932.1 YbaB/EbfC family nucleoid-associated protein [Pelagibacteraceae bacterium]MDC0953847.1 YbaB/EbfC family nucleoid-associated protein [Pelagibacteraceae bacterium]
MDFSKMLEQAQEMQKKMADAKESLKNISVEGESGGGGVKVILNGNGEMISIQIDPKILAEEKSVIEDLIVAATNNAKKNVESKTQEEMSKLTGGLQLPTGFKLPF